MRSRTWTRAPIEPRLALLAHLLGGGVFGLALARTLFEAAPQLLTALGDWPGTLALGTLGALAGGLLTRLPRRAAAAPSPAPALALLLPLLHLLAPDVNLLRGLVLLAGSVLLCAHLQTRRPLSLFLFLFLFSLYLSGLAPSVGEADTFEFQVGIARLGVAHGSGYPLLMLLGKLFTWLPVGGTLAWRANLTSAFFGALAAVGVERLSRRLGAGSHAALLAGLAFGLSPTLWSRAVEVEAYTLNAALVVALLLLALDLLNKNDQPFRLGASRFGLTLPRPALLAWLLGLSLTNHLTTLLLGPALGLALGVSAWRSLRILPRAARPAFVARLAGRLGLALLLGLAVYAYVPLRWPAVNNGEWMSLAQFANLLAGNEARGAFQWNLPLRDAGRWPIAFGKLSGEYGPLPLGLAVLGLAALLPPLARRLAHHAQPTPSPFHALVLVLSALPYFYFGLAFNVPDPDYSAFFIPLHLLSAVLMARGLQALLQIAAPTPQPTTSALPAALLSLFALLPLSQLWTYYPRVDQSSDWERQRLGEFILGQPLAPNAAILADSQRIAPLYYLQVAEGVRPDLDVIVLPDEAAYRAVLDERIAHGQVVYLARYLPGLGSGYSLRSVGPLAEVSPAPFMQPPDNLLPPQGQPPITGLRLLGHSPDPGGYHAAPPAHLDLTLTWQAAATPEANLLVNLRLVDEHGAVAWRNAGSVPVGGLYPTNAWRPGEVVSDYHRLPLEPHLAPGVYRLEAGLFPPFADEAGWFPITSVEVREPAAPPQPSNLLRARFGDQWLLGYDLPETAAHGARVPLTLYWLRGPEQVVVTALGETRSLAPWPVGALAPQRYVLAAPAAEAELPVLVAAGQPARCGWLQPASSGCPLPPVLLVGEAAAEGAVNFGHLMLLRRADLLTTSAAPGGQVSVELEWQGLQTMSEDYTIFVHLLGPDGLVHGQVDAWPVSGTRATSTWAPGAVLRDPYLVNVPANAPPGEYLVEIGVYLLRTGERLPVLNVDSQPVDDRLLLAGLTITP